MQLSQQSSLVSTTRPLPDFIGIGAQRSGTTWLHTQLNNHPEIWMPPIKELHFFERFTSRKPYYHFNPMQLRRRLKVYLPFTKLGIGESPPNLFWDVNYFFRRRDLNWYVSNFKPDKDQLAGEITPGYSILNREMVEVIYALNPNIKIIFLMRDPIERAWSGALLSNKIAQRDDFQKVRVRELLKVIKNSGMNKQRTDYLHILSIWESVIPATQFHIDFYDNIKEYPQRVLQRIFEFLGVQNIAVSEYILRKQVGIPRGSKLKIPPIIEYKLAEMNIDQLEILSKRFGGHTTKWLERTKKVLENNKNND